MSRLETLNVQAGHANVFTLHAIDLVVSDGQVTVLIGALQRDLTIARPLTPFEAA